MFRGGQGHLCIHTKTHSLIKCSSRPFYAAGTRDAPQAVRGGAERSQARGCEKEQGGGCSEGRGAETSGGVTKRGGEGDECPQRETEPEQSHQAAEPRA